MATGFNQNTDLYRLYSVVQNTMIRVPKDLVISSLREYFKKDSLYHYVSDEWGFPKTPDHTDLAPDAGLYNDLTSRVFIGEAFRYDGIFYPAILIKSGGVRHVPIAMNRDQHRVDYATTRYVDGYGNSKLVQVPSNFVLSGAWEGTIQIDVLTRGMRERDDLVELIAIFFADLHWNEMFKSGVSIKSNINVGSASETEDRNDKLFRQTITLDYRSEWRREIPVENVVDIIAVCIDFGSDIDGEFVESPNLQISSTIEYLDFLQTLE